MSVSFEDLCVIRKNISSARMIKLVNVANKVADVLLCFVLFETYLYAQTPIIIVAFEMSQPNVGMCELCLCEHITYIPTLRCVSGSS